MAYLIIFGIFVVLYFICAPLYKQAAELQAQGKIITRNPNFVETAQIFILSNVSMENIIAALKAEGLPFAGLEWKTGDDAMGFWYDKWTAQVVKIDSDDDRDRYKFNFTEWQPYAGTAVNSTQMNQLLTAIEKAFIKLDSNTKVQTERIKFNTK